MRIPKFPMPVLLVAAAATAALSAGVNAQEATSRPVVEEEHRVSCRHYETRARLKSREENVDFDVILADSCRLALDLLEGRRDGSAETLHGSAVYLERLTAFRRQILQMNISRVYGDGPVPIATPRGDQRRYAASISPGFRPVTETGEYLIARSMGVQAAYRFWLKSGAPFELARR